MEAATTGEAVDRFHDPAAGRLDLGQHGFQVVGVQDGQGRLGLIGLIGVKPAVQTLIEGGIGRAVIHEGPAERLVVEFLGRGQVGGGQFEVVQLSVFTHG